MHLSDFSGKVLSWSETVYRWLGALSGLDTARRAKVADYADDIAATLARAAEAVVLLQADGRDATARRQIVREFGRIAGYVETMVGPLKAHLDGRKLAGVKRRLEQLQGGVVLGHDGPPLTAAALDRIVAAEGYFRALADGLRA